MAVDNQDHYVGRATRLSDPLATSSLPGTVATVEKASAVIELDKTLPGGRTSRLGRQVLPCRQGESDTGRPIGGHTALLAAFRTLGLALAGVMTSSCVPGTIVWISPYYSMTAARQPSYGGFGRPAVCGQDRTDPPALVSGVRGRTSRPSARRTRSNPANRSARRISASVQQTCQSVSRT